ncbi:MAG TPA: zinc ribbon domain-containing protein [Phycisphaerales bacterium]|nr:zinc ribbon domain-containing protein [Phycisphaerales bacterium]
MPTYDYKCKTCGHTWELFQSMTAKPERTCPACGRKTAERLIGTGAALLFKGSGFYETDYRSEGYKKAAEADKKSGSGADATKGDAKPEKTVDTKAPVAADTKPKADAKPTTAKPALKSKKKGGE